MRPVCLFSASIPNVYRSPSKLHTTLDALSFTQLSDTLSWIGTNFPVPGNYLLFVGYNKCQRVENKKGRTRPSQLMAAQILDFFNFSLSLSLTFYCIHGNYNKESLLFLTKTSPAHHFKQFVCVCVVGHFWFMSNEPLTRWAFQLDVTEIKWTNQSHDVISSYSA